jgi:hypothetical protein
MHTNVVKNIPFYTWKFGNGSFLINKLVYQTDDLKIPDFRKKKNIGILIFFVLFARSAIHHHKLTNTMYSG